MRKELIAVLVSVILLIVAVFVACQKAAMPEGSPPPPPSPSATAAPNWLSTGTPAQTPNAPPPTTKPPSPNDSGGLATATPRRSNGGVVVPDSGTPGKTPGLAAPSPTELPLISVAEWQKVAFNYVSQKYNLPANELRRSASVARRAFPLTGIVWLEGIVGYDKENVHKSWIVAVDQNGKVYEPDGMAAQEEAERAAYRAAYGKMDQELYEVLQTKGPEDMVLVSITVTGGRTASDVWAVIATRYPEARLEMPSGRASKDTPLDLYWNVIYPEYLKEMTVAAAQATKSLTEYLRGQGYTVNQVLREPTISAHLPKRVILDVQKREDVGPIVKIPDWPKGEMDTASPSISAPSNWSGAVLDASGRPITGEGVSIGIIDAGTVDFSNPYVNRGDTVGTPNIGEHPTMVAGAAASNHPLYRGPAYKSYIVSADKGTGDQYKNATDLVNSAGARVVNLSWGSYSGGLTPLDMFYDYKTRIEAITVVPVAGNDSAQPVKSPGKGYNVITVGGFDDRDTVTWTGDVWWDTPSEGSAWKNGLQNNEKPELMAVSSNLWLIVKVGGFYDPNGDGISDTQQYGTSFAAPQVTGGVAMLFQKDSSLVGEPEAVKAILMASAIHNIEGNAALVQDPQSGEPSDVKDGAGAVNLAEACKVVDEGWWEFTFPNISSNFDENGWYTRSSPQVQLGRYQRLRAAIAWDSYVDLTSSPQVDELRTKLSLHLFRLDGQTETRVAASELTTSAIQSIDYYSSTANEATYKIKVKKESSTESGNILGLAWWVGDRYYAASSVLQEERSSDIAIFQAVLVDSVSEPREPSCSGNEATVPGGIRSYQGRATYPGLDPAYGTPYSTRHPIWMKGVEAGDYPFDYIDQPQINDDQGWATFSYTTSVSTAQAPLKLARMGMTLDGSCIKAYEFYQYYDSISAPDEDVSHQTAWYRQFQRGDAQEQLDDNPANDVNITDALYIANYLAQNPGYEFDKLNAANAASPRHDNLPYDKVSIHDSMFISQYLSNVRDAFFELLSKAGNWLGGGGGATVEAGSVELKPGASGRIPITLKKITGNTGIGGYDMRVTYDPAVIKVELVDGGVSPFGKLAAYRINDKTGVIRVNGFHAEMPGMTKDGAIAYLNIKALSPSGHSSVLRIQVKDLCDVVGNDVTAQVVDGTVAIK